jgi:hypothetical protein
MFIVGLGALFFGLTVGWITYRILRRKAGAPWLSDLIALGGVIGGAAVLAFFRSDVVFGWYAIGLVIGFFAYFAVGVILYGKQEVQPWRLEQVSPASTSDN